VEYFFLRYELLGSFKIFSFQVSFAKLTYEEFESVAKLQALFCKAVLSQGQDHSTRQVGKLFYYDVTHISRWVYDFQRSCLYNDVSEMLDSVGKEKRYRDKRSHWFPI